MKENFDQKSLNVFWWPIINMVDHFDIGRKAITNAAEAQLCMMGDADNVVFANPYGSSDIFQTALRRVGKDSLASRFVDPGPQVTPRVRRINQNEEVLTGVIASLERADVDFARQLEQAQRDIFYADGIAYLHPHWVELMREDTKQRLQEGIREHGTELGQYNVRIIQGEGKQRGTALGCVSLAESIFAIYANLALGNQDHVGRVIEEVFDLYYDEESGLFRNDYSHGAGPVYRNWDRTVSMLRGLDLAGDERGQRLFDEDRIMEELEKDPASDSPKQNRAYRLVALALGLEHFGAAESLARVRDSIVDLLRPPTETRALDGETHYFGHESGHNAWLCRLGLALTGLEKGKPNSFYTS